MYLLEKDTAVTPPPSRTQAPGHSPRREGAARGRACRQAARNRGTPCHLARRPPQAGRRVCTSSLTGSGTIAWLPLRGCTRMQSGRTDQAKKFTKAAGSAPEREGSTWQFSTGFPTWAGLRPWPAPGRNLSRPGARHHLQTGMACRGAPAPISHGVVSRPPSRSDLDPGVPLLQRPSTTLRSMRRT